MWCLWGCGQRACVVHMSTGRCALKHFPWRSVAEGLVQACIVVEGKPPTDATARLANRRVGFDEHLLVFQAAPQAFDEDVVEKPPLAVHADAHTAARQFVNEIPAGELHPLIGVEYLRLSVSIQCVLQRLDTERHVQPDRYSPCQNTSAEPVHHRNQIHKAFRQRDVCDVRAPHLVRPVDDEISQKIRVHLVFRVTPAGVRLLVDRLKPHQTHQPAHAFAVHRLTFPSQNRNHAA